MLTKKHYSAISLILRTNVKSEAVRASLAKELAAYFKQENPQFDKDRFLDNCFDFMVPAGKDAETCNECGQELANVHSA